MRVDPRRIRCPCRAECGQRVGDVVFAHERVGVHQRADSLLVIREDDEDAAGTRVLRARAEQAAFGVTSIEVAPVLLHHRLRWAPTVTVSRQYEKHSIPR